MDEKARIKILSDLETLAQWLTVAREMALYHLQPYPDLTGVPVDDATWPCVRSGCRGALAPVPGTQHFDADGAAFVTLECDAGCGWKSAHYWTWPTAVTIEDLHPEIHGEEEDL
jgi:hypothetical protein